MARKKGSSRALPLHALLRRDARHETEKGGVVVEFAILSPLLFFLLGAIIDYSLMFNDYQSLRSGTREGARAGSVLNFGSQANCTLAPTVGPPTNNIRNLMCTTKKQIGLSQDRTRVRIMLADGALTTNIPNGYIPGNSLIVCTMTAQKSATGMLSSQFDNKFLKTKTAIRIEQLPPATIERDGYEQALPGGDWNWCSSPGQVSP